MRARGGLSLCFANPLHMDTAYKDTPGARCHVIQEPASFRWATVEQANKLWDDLGTADPQNPNRVRRLTFAVDPADLYERYAGSAYLPCTLELPVIRRIGMVLTGYARGIPPFTTFEFQIRERTVEEWQLRSAKSIDLVMEVEGIPTGAPAQVPTCTSTP